KRVGNSCTAYKILVISSIESLRRGEVPIEVGGELVEPLRADCVDVPPALPVPGEIVQDLRIRGGGGPRNDPVGADTGAEEGQDRPGAGKVAVGARGIGGPGEIRSGHLREEDVAVGPRGGRVPGADE